MRQFDVYGSHYGAYILNYNSPVSKHIPGITGHVSDGIVTDKYFKGEYNIYLAKRIDENRREYYALKDGDRLAMKINGLPDDAILLAIHNLGGVNFFGSSDGAYKLKQGELIGHRVPGTAGKVGRIVLGGSAREDDATFHKN